MNTPGISKACRSLAVVRVATTCVTCGVTSRSQIAPNDSAYDNRRHVLRR